jgi:hypothetical protein
VEAYFHAEKFRPHNKAFFDEFSIESKSELSRSDGAGFKSAGRKRLNLDATQLQEWSTRKREVLRKAFRAKFRQNEDLKMVLLATYPAQLTHKPGRFSEITVETELMEVRREFLLAEEKEKGKSNEKPSPEKKRSREDEENSEDEHSKKKLRINSEKL